MIRISNGTLTALLSPLGAEPVSLKRGDRELLWQNENGSWAGHAPLLFPVCGMRSFSDGGKICRPLKHGWARKSTFVCERAEKTEASFLLCDSPETLSSYPHPFRLRVTYRLEEDTFFLTYEVDNPAPSPLWFSCGGHESFALQAPLYEYTVRLPEREKTLHFCDGEGRLTGEAPFAGDTVSAADPRLDGSGSIILSGVKGEAELLRRGTCAAHLTFEGFENLVLWRPIGANMICIEPWLSLPERAGEDPEPISKIKGFLCVGAGESVTLMRSIRYFE